MAEERTWEIVVTAAEMALHLQQTAASRLREERQSLEREEAMVDDDDGRMELETRLERVQQGTDNARREKKERANPSLRHLASLPAPPHHLTPHPLTLPSPPALGLCNPLTSPIPNSEANPQLGSQSPTQKRIPNSEANPQLGSQSPTRKPIPNSGANPQLRSQSPELGSQSPTCKAFFANFFVDACTALSARVESAAEDEKPMEEDWWR